MPAKWVESLLKLQETDLRIRDIETRLATMPGELTRLKNRRDQLAASTTSAADAVRKIELQIKTFESEIANLTAESNRLRQQSVMVKKNNEYQAMLNSIALNKNKISDLESKILELMDEHTHSQLEYQRIKADNDASIHTIRDEFEEIVAFAGEIKAELAKLKASRPRSIPFVDGETLSRYNALLKGKNGGIPLVKVEGGICGSCHLRVSPQALNDISKAAVTYCSNCQHLLYDENLISD